MKLAKFIALLGTVAQGGILIYGFTQGDFSAVGEFFFSDPWGIVSLVDVYVGFMFFSAWIFFREKDLLTAPIVGSGYHYPWEFSCGSICLPCAPEQRRFLEAILDGRTCSR